MQSLMIISGALVAVAQAVKHFAAPHTVAWKWADHVVSAATAAGLAGGGAMLLPPGH